ncbi:hypothetical protein SUNI508_09054 [Seiridium unicorne]|uniref:Uncharacterized protein n=1 Tax=Seiridium unicorne TaxID=138068 RepID=A0ABR2URG8_9PEZI
MTYYIEGQNMMRNWMSALHNMFPSIDFQVADFPVQNQSRTCLADSGIGKWDGVSTMEEIMNSYLESPRWSNSDAKANITTHVDQSAIDSYARKDANREETIPTRTAT